MIRLLACAVCVPPSPQEQMEFHGARVFNALSWSTLARMDREIQVRAEVVEEMLRHARMDPHTECCGLLAGFDRVITRSFPVNNALASPTAYEIPPQELFQLFRRMREEGLEHLGIYHSHPSGENIPSRTDIAQAYYPQQAYFILAPQLKGPHAVRAFRIRDGNAEELKIIVVNV